MCVCVCVFRFKQVQNNKDLVCLASSDATPRWTSASHIISLNLVKKQIKKFGLLSVDSIIPDICMLDLAFSSPVTHRTNVALTTCPVLETYVSPACESPNTF